MANISRKACPLWPYYYFSQPLTTSSADEVAPTWTWSPCLSRQQLAWGSLLDDHRRYYSTEYVLTLGVPFLSNPDSFDHARLHGHLLCHPERAARKAKWKLFHHIWLNFPPRERSEMLKRCWKQYFKPTFWKPKEIILLISISTLLIIQSVSIWTAPELARYTDFFFKQNNWKTRITGGFLLPESLFLTNLFPTNIFQLKITSIHHTKVERQVQAGTKHIHIYNDTIFIPCMVPFCWPWNVRWE